MYDLLEAKTYKPEGDYKIDAAAFRDGGKDELIAALDGAETAERRKKIAKWRSIITTFVNLVVPAKQAPSSRAVASR